jgi:hypothetical protein
VNQPIVWYRYAIILFLIGWSGFDIYMKDWGSVIATCAMAILYLMIIPTNQEEATY